MRCSPFLCFDVVNLLGMSSCLFIFCFFLLSGIFLCCSSPFTNLLFLDILCHFPLSLSNLLLNITIWYLSLLFLSFSKIFFSWISCFFVPFHYRISCLILLSDILFYSSISLAILLLTAIILYLTSLSTHLLVKAY